jgi:hypothetical protein
MKHMPRHLTPDALAAEIAPLQERGNMAFELEWLTALAWISHLQLALRHPGAAGESSELVRASLLVLIERIGTVAPLTAEMLSYGWDQDYDVPRDYPRTT